MEPKGHAMAKPRRFAFPDETILARAELHLRARPHSLDNARLCASNAKQDAHDARSERRAEHLAEHGAAAFLLMLERKNAAIGKDAEIKPCRIRNVPEAEAAFAR